MTELTPGPWDYFIDGWHNNELYIVAADAPQDHIAEVFSSEEDVRLMVAAPELLNEVEEWHTFLIESATDSNPNKEAVLAKALQVDAVIAKARGETL